MIRAVDSLAAGSATLGAFVFAHVIIKAGKSGKRPVADRAVDAGVKFVFVAEHGSERITFWRWVS
jgi:hypothetical protein